MTKKKEMTVNMNWILEYLNAKNSQYKEKNLSHEETDEGNIVEKGRVKFIDKIRRNNIFGMAFETICKGIID